jgi:uncharacterized protein (TIGR03437 family)
LQRVVLRLMSRLALLALFVLAPAAVFAESAMPSIGYAGAPTDHGGQNCSTCHTGNTVNDPAGSLQVIMPTPAAYSPFTQQAIRIIVQHPQAVRWGFQITIRGETNPTASAGTFSLSSPPGPVQITCDNGTQFGSVNGCTNSPLRLYAEHVNAPFGAAGAFYEFDVNWTPPSQEIGRIHMYVAAVAADGDNTAKGDFVYTFSEVLQNIGKCNLTVVPILNAVLNGATFQAPVSSNAMVSLLGRNFQSGSGYPRTAGLGDFVGNAFPTELSCVSVQVTGPGLANPVLVPIAYVDTGQINAQMPQFTGTGTVTVTVMLNPGETNELGSTPDTLTTLQAYAPAFFVFPNSSSIAAEEAGTGTIVANSSVVAGASPARPGDVVSLFGTGFGATNPSVAPGALASGQAFLNNSITVSIGGVTLASSDVLYAGLSPGSISGLYQINVRIPSSVPSGNVPVSITIGGVQTQSGATIPIQ